MSEIREFSRILKDRRALTIPHEICKELKLEIGEPLLVTVQRYPRPRPHKNQPESSQNVK